MNDQNRQRNLIGSFVTSLIFALIALTVLIIAKIDLGAYTIFAFLLILLTTYAILVSGSFGLSKPLVYLILLVLFGAIVVVGWSYVLETYQPSVPAQQKGPYGTLLYLEKTEGGGGGLIVNTDENGIQIATGKSDEGTTFLLKTVTTGKGWPAFGADVYLYSPAGEKAKMKVTFEDVEYPSLSINFREIEIAPSEKLKYSSNYKLDRYFADKVKNDSRESIDDKRIGIRTDPPKHIISIEVYLPPNSYITMENMRIIRNY